MRPVSLLAYALIICEMPLLHLPVAVRNTVENVMEHRLR